MQKRHFFDLLINNKNINWNVKETFFILTTFDWIKLLRSKAATRTSEILFCNFILKETPAQVFSGEFSEISENTFFAEHLRVTVSVRFKKILCIEVKQIEAVFRRWNFYLQRYEKETPTQVFSWDICEFFKNIFFYRTTPVAALSELKRSLCGEEMLWSFSTSLSYLSNIMRKLLKLKALLIFNCFLSWSKQSYYF